LDRCALFVDASYALADGALAVHGTRNRDSVSWDHAGLLKLLGSLSRDRTGLPLLRCYWYDTVADGDRAAEHDTLADIPGVKLRLSKARPSRKEGVEAEIRKDLTALARNHAVSDVIIVSAEEDLGPVIAEVQDLGIRTILLHIATDGNWAMSRALRQECDDIIEIAPGHLRPYVDLISGAEPQLASTGYRELAANTTQGSVPQLPAIEAPAVRLYGSPAAAEYQLAGNGQGQGQDQRDLARVQDASRFGGQAAGGQGEVFNSGPILRSADNQRTPAQDQQLQQAAGLAPTQNVQTQAAHSVPPLAQPQMAQPQMAQPAMAQPAMAQPAMAQQPQAQPSQTQQYQHQDVGLAQVAASGETGFGQGGFTGQDPSRAQNGQLSHHQEAGFGQRTAGDDGRGQPGSLPGVASTVQPGMHGQNGAGPNVLGQNGMAQNGLGQNSLPPNGHGGAPGPMSNAPRGGQPGGGQPGGGQPGGGQFGGFAPQGGVGPQGATGMQGVGQHGGQVPGNGLPPGGLQTQGMPSPGMATGQPGGPPGQGAGMPGNGLQPSSMQPGGLPSAGMALGGTPGSHGAGLPSNGAANGLGGGHGGVSMAGGQQPNGAHHQPAGQQPGMPVQAGQLGSQPAQGHGQPLQGQPMQGQPLQGQPMQGQPLQGQPMQGQPLQGQPLQGQPMQGQPMQGQPTQGQQGLQRPGAPGMAPNGMMPLDAQRQQRQLPAGNTGPYAQDRSMPYGGQMQPAHFSGPVGSAPYPPSAYGGQPPAAPPPVAMSVGDAVQSAHAEGFGFGEAVARDAPALWLEAVLARKPRMPSDLEARLLQGSALPIDSLLHDEVRHALRRGFWDALERSRH
jgi:NYN domain